MSRHVEVVLLCDVSLRPDGVRILDASWARGPYPHRYEDHRGRPVTTDAAARATNFPVALGPALFGRGVVAPGTESAIADEVRFHRSLPVDQEPSDAVRAALASARVGDRARIRLQYAEILASDLAQARRDDELRPAVVALHLTVEAAGLDDAIRVVSTLARDRGPASVDTVRGAATYALLHEIGGVDEALVLPTGTDIGTEGGVYPLILAARESRPGRYAVEREELFRLAALQTRTAKTATADRAERALSATRELSVSWTMLALRNGAAFQLHLPEDDGFRPLALVYFRTLYTDAIMLAWLQDAILRSWERAAFRTLASLADRSDLGPARRQAADLDRAVAVDSLRYWMKRSAANTGRAVSVLHDVQNALDLPQRLDTVEEQIATLARLSDQDAVERQTRAQEALSTVAMVFAVAVFPVTVTADVVDLLGLSPAPGTVIPVLLGLMAVCGIGAFALRRFVLRRR